MVIDNDSVWVGGSSCIFKLDLNGNILKKYGTSDGLLPGPYYNMMVDNKGNKWISTDSGITILNGDSIINYTEANNISLDSITVIRMDSSGNVWVGTRDKGIWQFNGTSWINYNVNNSCFLFNSINAIYCSSDTIYVGSPDGIYYFFENKWSKSDYFQGYNISSILYTKNEGMIYISSHLILFEKYRNSNGFGDAMLYLNYKDSIYYSSRYGSIYKIKFDSIQTSISGYYSTSDIVYSLSYDKYGNLWYIDGNVHVKGSVEQDIFLDDNQLQSNVTLYLKFCKNENLWVGTNIGASMYDGKNWHSYDKSYIGANVVYCIEEDLSGNIWLGTENGISKYDGNNWFIYNNDVLFPGINKAVFSISADNNNVIWFSSYKGAISFDGSNWKRYGQQQGLTDNEIVMIIVDKKNTKWFGTSSGVYSFDGITWKNFNKDNSGLYDNNILNMGLDNDSNIYFHTAFSIDVFENNQWYTTRFLPNMCNIFINRNSNIFDSKNNPWYTHISTGVGLYKYGDGRWFKYTNPDYMYFRYLFKDSYKNIWLCSENNGISIYNQNCVLPVTPDYNVCDNVCPGMACEIGAKTSTREALYYNYKFKFNSLDTVTDYQYFKFTIGNDYKSGPMKIQSINLCGVGNTIEKHINVHKYITLSEIEGVNRVCPGQSLEYSVRADTAEIEYLWYFYKGSKKTTKNYISFNVDENATNFDVMVSGYNKECGYGTQKIKNVKVIRNNVDTISGKKLICLDKSNIMYSLVSDNPDELSYKWELPLGITGESDSSSILLNFDTSDTFNIKVNAFNQCDTFLRQIKVANSRFEKPLITNKWNDLLVVPDKNKVFNGYQWLLDGKTIVEANAQYLHLKKSGTYSVIVTNADACTDTSDFYNFSLIEEEAHVNPNPFSDRINIQFKNSILGKLNISIFDSKGVTVKNYRAIKNEEEFEYSFNAKELSEGLYILSITSGDNILIKYQIIKSR